MVKIESSLMLFELEFRSFLETFLILFTCSCIFLGIVLTNGCLGEWKLEKRQNYATDYHNLWHTFQWVGLKEIFKKQNRTRWDA